MRKFRIQSRWPAWARWKTVTAAPYGESNKFDKYGLYWDSWEKAQISKMIFESVNAGEYRIVEVGPDPLDQALNEGSGAYKP